MFIPHLLIYISAVLVICVDASTACLVRTFILQFQHVISTVYAMVMIYNWINLIEQLHIYSTIQKPNLCRQFSIQGFAAALKPAPFIGTYFKRWQIKTTLWLTTMNVFWVAGVTPTGTITPEQKKAFREATIVFVGAVLRVIGDKLVDAYLHVCSTSDRYRYVGDVSHIYTDH